MTANRLVFRIHALQRMFRRRISDEDVRHVLVTGKTIEAYPGAKPFPSRLVLGWRGPRPIHVVVADNTAQQETIVITVYEPGATEWEAGFEKRRRS